MANLTGIVTFTTNTVISSSDMNSNFSAITTVCNTTDGGYASKTGTEVFTNKTLTSPTINTPTIATPTITNKTSTGTDNGSETLVNKTLTSPTITTPIIAVQNGTLFGGMKLNQATKTTAYTITDTDNLNVVISENDANIQLPAVANNQGRMIYIYNAGELDQIQVQVTSGDKLIVNDADSGYSSFIILPYRSGITLFCCPRGWAALGYFETTDVTGS